jgi:type IV secretory pathway protease TraF
MLGTVGLAAAALAASRPVVILNTTASAPLGLYRVQSAGSLRVGDWIALRPPPDLAAWLSAQGYLPAHALLIKQIAALAPSRVCRQGADLAIDGTPRARAARADRWGRRLPAWGGCRTLAASEVFVLNRASGSLDGRYFGPLPRSAVVGQLAPLWLIERDPHAS